MNKFQAARDKANDRTEGFIERNHIDLDGNAQFAPLKLKFNDLRAKFREARLFQEEQVSPITETKNIRRDLVIDIVFKKMGIGHIQAFNLNETELAKNLKHTVTYLVKTTDEELFTRATSIKNIIAENLTILDDLTLADVTAMETAITDFNKKRGKPVEEIRLKKAKGTDPLVEILDAIDEVKFEMGFLIETSFPELYSEWKKETKVGKPVGVRKISLIVEYVDSETNDKLRNIMTTVTRGDIKHEKKSTKNGFSRFLSLESGKYTVTSEHPLYVTDIRNRVSVNDNGIKKLLIPMKTVEDFGAFKIAVVDKETGEVMAHVKVIIPGLSYSGTTNEEGEDVKKYIPIGTYEGKLSLEGYIDFDFTLLIEKGKTVEVEFLMEKEGE